MSLEANQNQEIGEVKKSPEQLNQELNQDFDQILNKYETTKGKNSTIELDNSKGVATLSIFHNRLKDGKQESGIGIYIYEGDPRKGWNIPYTYLRVIKDSEWKLHTYKSKFNGSGEWEKEIGNSDTIKDENEKIKFIADTFGEVEWVRQEHQNIANNKQVEKNTLTTKTEQDLALNQLEEAIANM